MWLLVYFLNEDHFLEEILEEFIETGVPGATILDGTGMLHYLSEEVPIFAGFRSIVKGTMPTNKVLLSVIREREKVDSALASIDRIVGGLAKGDNGVALTLRIEDFKGPAARD